MGSKKESHALFAWSLCNEMHFQPAKCKNVRIFRKRVSPTSYLQLQAPQSVINQLILVEQVQSRATRFIIGRDRDLCYKDRLIKLNLLPLNYWLEYLDLVFF